MTRYLVLRKNGNAWESEATVEARGAKAAIEKALAPKPPKEGEPAEEPKSGEFVAVSARNWQPRKVGVTTETKITVT
jgi:hypothetical protein